VAAFAVLSDLGQFPPRSRRLSAEHGGDELQSPVRDYLGFLNEAETDQDYVRPIFEDTVASLRALDPLRLVSYASRLAETDLCFDLVDLIAINAYPGWYGCEEVEQPLELIKPQLDRCIASIDARGFSQKPVIIGEIGAEGLYGWHDAHNDAYTEEYQAEYLRLACKSALGNPRCSGVAIWQFSDCRTYGKGRALQRPRTFNNKGMLDEYRRPKAAYKAVRAAFLKDAHHANGSASLSRNNTSRLIARYS